MIIITPARTMKPLAHPPEVSSRPTDGCRTDGPCSAICPAIW
jgi:hypothetical protein